MGELYLQFLAVYLAAVKIDGVVSVCFRPAYDGGMPRILAQVATDELVYELAAKLGAGVARHSFPGPDGNQREWLTATYVSYEVVVEVMGPHHSVREPERTVLS